MGVGPELFLEIAKFRALRYLLMRLQEIHGRAVELHVVAEIGFSNKSLKDPYTNLLRQSTEALSAIAGGADALIVNPYDELSSEGSDAFSRRMALNVSNLLQEEAHLDAVADPLNGSYVIEALSSALIDKAWECLQDFCDSHAFNNEQLTAYFKPRVEATRALRLADFESKNKTLIGINAYPNTFETKTKQWAPLPTEAGLPYLIYEMCAHS
jgi:methylmalonyl-CoA mutase